MKMVMLKTVFFAVVCLGYSVHASQASGAKKISSPAISIKWLGGPTMLINFNNFQILTDPMFGEGENAFLMGDPNEMFDLAKGPNVKHHKRLSHFSSISLEHIDLVLLSHAHEDHFDQEAEQRLSKSTPILLPPADLQTVRSKGFNTLKVLAWGKSASYNAGDAIVKITAVNAHHSANNNIDTLLGVGNGYWIEFKHKSWRRTIYWTGDTLPTEDVIKQIKKLGRPDVLVPHLGRVGTTGPLGLISMGADEVTEMASELLPKKILPIHHSTYSHYLEPISQLIKKNQGVSYGIDLISEGSTVVYE
jgi:N-acyl-phosphatidylethanolamine-hydrolysing phospholipase D